MNDNSVTSTFYWSQGGGVKRGIPSAIHSSEDREGRRMGWRDGASRTFYVLDLKNYLMCVNIPSTSMT